MRIKRDSTTALAVVDALVTDSLCAPRAPVGYAVIKLLGAALGARRNYRPGTTRRATAGPRCSPAAQRSHRTQPNNPTGVGSDDTAADTVGWYPDPTGRHESRYFNGQWTQHVSTRGVNFIDPFTASPAPAAGAQVSTPVQTSYGA